MSKLLVVLGAGASREVNLPIGDGLKEEITRALNFHFENFNRMTSGDPGIYEALKIHVRTANIRDGNVFIHAGRRIAANMPLAISIDNFLDAHRGKKEIELCGKLAIVQRILAAERRSKLYIDHQKPHERLTYSNLTSTWFNSFWQILSENCTVDEIEQRLASIAVVSFNYDRCFAHFLYNALQDYYELDAGRAGELARRVEIFHPYGSVGSLPWFEQPNSVPFGAEVHAQQLLALSSQIKTFTEGTDPESNVAKALWMRAAEATHVAFLGFAFHPQNFKLIWPEQRSTDSRAALCIGSALGISESDLDVIRSQLYETLHVLSDDVKLPNLSCHDLFRNYRRTLSAALLSCCGNSDCV